MNVTVARIGNDCCTALLFSGFLYSDVFVITVESRVFDKNVVESLDKFDFS